MDENVFVVTDPLGYTVVCSKGSWKHVVSNHDELEGRHEEVASVIVSPEVIYASKSRPDDNYVASGANSRTGKRYIKTVVQVDRERSTGFLKTAYTAMSTGGENIDASKKLYPKDSV